MKIRFYPAILPYFLEKVKAEKKEKDTNSGVVKEKDDRAAGGVCGGQKAPCAFNPRPQASPEKSSHPKRDDCFFSWWTITDSLFCGKATAVAACHRHAAKSRLSSPLSRKKQSPPKG